MLAAGVFDSPLTLLAGVTCGALAAGLTSGRAAPVGWALAGLALEYVAGLLARSAPIDLAAPLFGAALLLVAELAYLSLELRRPASDRDRVLQGRLLAIAGLAGAALVLGGLYEAAAILPLPGGIGLTVAGVVAAVAAAALLTRLATGIER